jgi:hypothetical protein
MEQELASVAAFHRLIGEVVSESAGLLECDLTADRELAPVHQSNLSNRGVDPTTGNGGTDQDCEQPDRRHVLPE